LIYHQNKTAGISAFTVSTLLILTFVLLMSCQKTSNELGWDDVPEILSQIIQPVFPDRDYIVTEFGASGDSITDCYDAFKKAIKQCNMEGGGRVVVPEGSYLINGPIHLKSNVHLYLSEGSRLEFSTNIEDYLPVVLTRWEGVELFNYSPFIYAYQATNVAITGKGIIDGNAINSFVPWKKKQKKDQLMLRQMGNDGIPVHERIFGDGHFIRPSTIQTYGCKNVLIDGITIYDAPFWVIHPTFCTNVTVRNVIVDSWNPNNDGVNPDASVNVLIEDCVFNTGDDAVAIKSGRDQDGWRIGQATENVIIRNCTMNSKANGLCIGSEMSGSVRNVYMENCQLGEAKSTIYFKANLDRGGVVENVYVRDVKVKRAITAFIRFESNYKGHRGNHYPPIFRNFTIERVICEIADHYGIYAVGIEGTPISNLRIRDIVVNKAAIPFYSQFVADAQISNVSINDITYNELSLGTDLPVSNKKLTF